MNNKTSISLIIYIVLTEEEHTWVCDLKGHGWCYSRIIETGATKVKQWTVQMQVDSN